MTRQVKSPRFFACGLRMTPDVGARTRQLPAAALSSLSRQVTPGEDDEAGNERNGPGKQQNAGAAHIRDAFD